MCSYVGMYTTGEQSYRNTNWWLALFGGKQKTSFVGSKLKTSFVGGKLKTSFVGIQTVE
jgi:hypothetical protein